MSPACSADNRANTDKDIFEIFNIIISRMRKEKKTFLYVRESGVPKQQIDMITRDTHFTDIQGVNIK